MSRCARTDALLEASFGQGISRADAGHAAQCPECARALAAARRFETELRTAGIELSPEPMPAAEEVVMVTDGSEPRPGRVWFRIVAGGVATAALVGAFYFGGRWLGDSFGSVFEPPGGTFGNLGEAAALIGAPQNGVLVTEDGVVGIRDLGATLELVLVRSTEDGLTDVVLDAVSDSEISVISCVELAQGDFVWGSSPGVTAVEGDGEAVVRDDELIVFAFAADAAARRVTLVERNGLRELDRGDWDGQECTVRHAQRQEAQAAAARAAVRAAREAPEAVRCADWQRLGEAAQLTLTSDVIFEWLMPAVRAREDLPDATVDEVVHAARSSFDRACQDAANDRKLVDDLAILLYGQ
jgi:hypothetical protein